MAMARMESIDDEFSQPKISEKWEKKQRILIAMNQKKKNKRLKLED